ncbi:hypothetical protein [Streptomyces abikoensis]|uniref:Uncharacterized protein n=1 Tax=Streptomyces abikoensis TaxID=97398 RepID=A0ABW7T9Y1_9ACTN
MSATETRISVAHKVMREDVLRRNLAHQYKADDVTTWDALEEVNFPTRMRGDVALGRARRDNVILFYLQEKDSLQVLIYNLRGDPYEAAQDVWDGIRKTLNGLAPKFKNAEIRDDSATYVEGDCERLKGFVKDNRPVSMLTAVAALLLIAIGASVAALQVPALIAGVVSLLFALLELRGWHKIVWRAPGRS